jgi:flagellar protein FlaG
MSISAVGMSSAIQGGPVTAAMPMRDQSGHGQAEENVVQSNKNVEQMVVKMQNYIDEMSVGLEFTMYGNHGEKIAVAVVNKETGELIREIPPKELRNLYTKMSELAGMIFNREI